MACFDNIVTVEGLCEDVASTSGFTLNQIGINKSEIEQIMTNDYDGVQDFVDRKANFATEKVTGEIYTFLSPKFKADSILTGARVGFPDINKTLVTQSGFVGVQVSVHNPGSYVDFVVSDFSLFTDFTGNVPVLIYDLYQGLLLDTVTVPTVAGQISTVYTKSVISSPRKSLNLWIGYDATAINSYKTATHNGCSDCRGYTFNHKFVQAVGASIVNPFTDGNVTGLTHTGGLSFNYSINCNHKDWLCAHRNILSLPILYKTGIEICNHALLASPNQRTMAITTVNRELMEQKLAYFTSEYNTLMGNILRNMSVPQDRNCFQCDNKIVSRSTLA